MITYEIVSSPAKPEPSAPVRVRLVPQATGHTLPAGPTLEVQVGTRWLAIATLTNDGMLALYDMYRNQLTDAGFNIDNNKIATRTA